MPVTPRSRILAVLLAAVVLIGGANLAAYAANGQPLLLGKTGVATKKTTVKNNGAGPALHLKTKPGQPPLTVNRTKKVNKLNADLVDGHSATDLENRIWVYRLSTGPGKAGFTVFSLPGLPAGRYTVDYTVGVDFSTTPSWFACWVSDGTDVFGLTLADDQNGYGHLSGSTYLDTTGGGTATMTCQTSQHTFQVVDGGYRSEVIFTRVDEVTETGSVGSRGTGRGDRAGR